MIISPQSLDTNLSQLLAEVKSGSMQLPEFQRDWTWDDNRIRGIIASLSQGYPMGAIMRLQYGNPDIQFKYRTITGVTGVSVKPEHLILDGQQRLTSIYQATSSKEPVSTKTEKGKAIKRYYYLSMEKCLDDDEDRFDAILSIPEDRKIKENFDRDVKLDLSTREYEYENKLFPVNIVFDSNAVILAGYHQYFAVKKAIESTKHATVTDGKGGVFWHTQGSGKSLSMVFYAHYLQEALESPTIVVITDRNDLDDQLYGQFARCKDFLRQTPQHAESRKNLKELLANRQANGIIFTTMQKFEESNEALSERRNIIVMADEAHRGQYGLNEKVVVKQKDNGEVEAKTVIGTARIIRDTLPNATYIGFTGTPISTKDRSTREVFGDYIDIYDMTQAVEDGATRPVYYESRVIHLKLDENTLHLIDNEYDIMADNADPYVIEKSKKELGQMEAILGADQTINSLVNDILDHYENYRENILTGKAMIVAYSRPIAMKIYKRILELRPAWTEKIAVVMTQGNNDPEEWREIIGNKAHKDDMARKFKDNNSPLKIAIVVDMWLTGFDVPSLATMYVYKPMAGHNLMQAIARVNRVFKDKEGGSIF